LGAVREIVVFSGNAHRELARSICDHLGVPLSPVELTRFSNDCIQVQLQANCRQRDVYLVQPLAPPTQEHLVELLLMIDAARGASADKITAVIPYYAYARSDKKDASRLSIGGRLVADLLATAGVDRVITMALHAPQVHGFFSVPVDHLTALGVLADHFLGQDLTDRVVVSPDFGNAKQAAQLGRLLGLPVAAGSKKRLADDRVVIDAVVGDVAGRRAIVLDDEIATGGSIVELLDRLRDQGCVEAAVACTHGLFTGKAVERLRGHPMISELVVTDTVPPPVPPGEWPGLEIRSVAGLLSRCWSPCLPASMLSGLVGVMGGAAARVACRVNGTGFARAAACAAARAMVVEEVAPATVSRPRTAAFAHLDELSTGPVVERDSRPRTVGGECLDGRMAKHTETPRSGHPIEALRCSLRDEIADSSDLPAWSMDAETTTRVVALAAQVAAGVAEVEARAVGQAQALDLPGQTGCKSTTRWLQNTTHVTHATAKAKVDLATALAAAETTRAAMATGEVHAEQAVAIGTHLDRLDTETVTLEQKHSAEAFLVEHASAHDAHHLSRMGDAIWSHLDPDGWEAREAALLEAQEERARARTTFSMRDDGQGMTHTSTSTTPARATTRSGPEADVVRSWNP
jgi:ribose-phosphate pyrophosphokinase